MVDMIRFIAMATFTGTRSCSRSVHKHIG